VPELIRLRRDRRIGAARHDHRHLLANQISRQRRQSIVLIVPPSKLDDHVQAHDVASLIQTAMECGNKMRERLRRPAAEKPDHRHCRLLRASRERPCHRRSAEQADELPPPHAEHGGSGGSLTHQEPAGGRITRSLGQT
jgi:hypothetical protein